MFSTDRLILRQFEESDLDDMLRMRNQAEVRRVLSYGYLVPSSPSFEQTMRQWVCFIALRYYADPYARSDCLSDRLTMH